MGLELPTGALDGNAVALPDAIRELGHTHHLRDPPDLGGRAEGDWLAAMPWDRDVSGTVQSVAIRGEHGRVGRVQKVRDLGCDLWLEDIICLTVQGIA